MMMHSKHAERKSVLRKCALAGLVVPLIIAAATDIRAVRAQAIAPKWRNARHISAAELAEKLSGSAKTRLIILQVGFSILYDGAHIPGAIFGGAASTAQGLAKLKASPKKFRATRKWCSTAVAVPGKNVPTFVPHTTSCDTWDFLVWSCS
jgi:hypothetical protein